jgi:TPR repeat protein
MKRVRFFHLWVALAMLVCIATVWAQSKGIDPSLLAKAKAGDANAEFQLALRLMNGSGGVQQDTREAMIEFQKAAEKGNAEAQYMLGQIYEDGGMGMAVPDSDGSYTNGRVVNFHPVPNDFGLAAKWYRMAAKQGNALAQNHLGLIYADGRGVPQDYAEAYFWLSLASANGSHSSTNGVDDRDLAASHLTKTVLLQTQERARKWFEDHPGRPNPFK